MITPTQWAGEGRGFLYCWSNNPSCESAALSPTAVQGDDAPGQIVRAIELANARQECDVLIVGRGGGSLEDLWSFNDERVARAIFASAIPIAA